MQDGTYFYSTSESSTQEEHIDSILKPKARFVGMNYSGRYKKAVEKVFQEEDFVREYLKFMHISGGGNPSVLTDRLINSTVAYDDYFIKRLILTTLVYYT